jgi:hypothetical protein
MKGSNDGTDTGTGQVLRVEGTNVVRVPFGVRRSRRPRPQPQLVAPALARDPPYPSWILYFAPCFPHLTLSPTVPDP